MKTTNLVHESLDQLFEEKNKKVELTKKLKTQGGTTVKHSKTSKADEAIAGLRKQLEKAKKPGAYRTTVEKRAAIADLEKKIKSWEDKKKVNESIFHAPAAEWESSSSIIASYTEEVRNELMDLAALKQSEATRLCNKWDYLIERGFEDEDDAVNVARDIWDEYLNGEGR